MSEQLTIVIDTREQTPLRFSDDVSVEVKGLNVGDYSAKGLERHVVVERKSLPDLVASLTTERERFEREVFFMRSIPYRCLVVEAGFLEAMQGRWRARATPKAVIASLASWSGKYCLPVMFCGDPAGTAVYVETFIKQAVRNIRATLEATSVIGVLDHAAMLSISHAGQHITAYMSDDHAPKEASDFI
jgi:ERCC4-type nuclease